MIAPWEDPRVIEGLGRQVERRRRRLDGGEHPIGWKVGFGAPASLELMQISAPLLGFLTSSTVRESGDAIDVGHWTKGVVEFEVAVRMGRDVGAGLSPGAAADAVDALAPALELADLDGPVGPERVADIVASNIFHKAVILGNFDTDRSGIDIDGLVGVISVDGDLLDRVTDLEAATGRYSEIVATVAATLESVGLRLRAGDVIITGSIIAPVPITAGRRFAFELAPLPAVSVAVRTSDADG